MKQELNEIYSLAEPLIRAERLQEQSIPKTTPMHSLITFTLHAWCLILGHSQYTECQKQLKVTN